MADPRSVGALPEMLVLREVCYHIDRPGFRTHQITLVTTLLDAEIYRVADLAELYHQRWRVETSLAQLKTTMQMDVLRCKTPAIVRQEIWGHLLVSNLLRAAMAQAAVAYGVVPRQVRPQGTRQTLTASRKRCLTPFLLAYDEPLVYVVLAQ